MDGFIFVDTNHRRLKKKSHIRGVQKSVAIIFSFIIHTKNRYFVGTGIHGSDPPRKPRKLVPHEI